MQRSRRPAVASHAKRRAHPSTGLRAGDRSKPHRDGHPRRLHHRHRHPGLLLRPARTLAARLQRKHQRPAPPVPAQRHRPVTALRCRPARIAASLNGRPRKTLGYMTPSESSLSSLRTPVETELSRICCWITQAPGRVAWTFSTRRLRGEKPRARWTIIELDFETLPVAGGGEKHV